MPDIYRLQKDDQILSDCKNHNVSQARPLQLSVENDSSNPD